MANWTFLTNPRTQTRNRLPAPPRARPRPASIRSCPLAGLLPQPGIWLPGWASGRSARV